MPMDVHSRKSKVHLGRSSLSTGDGGYSYHSYLDAIQREFHDQPEVYKQFLATLKQFRQNEISATTILQRVADLLKGHPALIDGFNVFLPAGVNMDTSVDSSPAPTTLPSLPSLRSTQVQAQAVDKLDNMYIIVRLTEQVRQRCRQDVYEDFITILADHYHRTYVVDQELTTRKLKSLLSDDADLLDQLHYILGSHDEPM